MLAPISTARTESLLAAFRDVSVAVVGDVMLDRFLRGDAERISPEAPVPVVTITEEQDGPGGAANVAVNAAAMGAKVHLVGVVGDDADAVVLRQHLEALDIATSGLIVATGRSTTTKTRIVARGQQVVRIDREATNLLARRDRDAVVAAAHQAIPQADALLIGDYDKGTIDAAFAGDLIAAAQQRRIPIIVDPKLRHFFAYHGVTVFKPNRRELDAAFGNQFMAGGDEAELGAARRRLGAEHLLVTLGAEGMMLVSDDQPVRVTGSDAREVFDVSGAGDTVAAWIAVSLAAGGSIDEAAWLANVAAGIEVGKRGTASVAPEELRAALAHRRS